MARRAYRLEKIIREQEWHVLGCDMVAPTKIQQLLGAEKKWASRFEFHQMNITQDVDKLEELIKRSDTVINLAAICNPSEYIKQPVNTINSNFTDAQACHNSCPSSSLAPFVHGRRQLFGICPFLPHSAECFSAF